LYFTTFLLVSFLSILPSTSCPEPHILGSIIRSIGKGYEYDPNEALDERLIRCKGAIDNAFVDHVADDSVGPIPRLYISQVGTFLGTDEIFDYFCLQTEPRLTLNWYVPLGSFQISNVTADHSCNVFLATRQATAYYDLPISATPPLIIETFVLGHFSGHKLLSLEVYYKEFFVFLQWLSILQHQTHHLDTNAIWCNIINNNCASALTSYCTEENSVPNCVNCTTFLNSIPQSSAFPGQSNSTVCRIIHASMTYTTPEVKVLSPLANYRHCMHAGHSGGGICVPPY